MDTNNENTEKLEVPVRVFLDSGMQKTFIPLCTPMEFTLGRGAKAPKSLLDALEKVEGYRESGALPESSVETICKESEGNKCPYSELMPSVRWRYGAREWKMPNGSRQKLYGIWLLVETNTSGADRNSGGLPRYDRGYFYRRRDMTLEESQRVIDSYFHNATLAHGPTPFLDAREGSKVRLSFPFESSLEFELWITKPSANCLDVDIVVDLGNSRTSALVFEHNAGIDFPIDKFREKFTPLRLQTDPDSGNADEYNGVGDAIASSWFVLHELDYQTYSEPGRTAPPANLLTSIEVTRQPEIQTVRKWPRKDIVIPPEGDVVERIPQMFCKLSPVVIGESATHFFDLPYAKNMAEAGAVIQQSSPKRYYWDDIKRAEDWNMLLNDFDPAYRSSPETYLPGLQGEMLRFMREDAKLFDLGSEDSVERPLACPKTQRYPRQSTLTWFLLHIIERAFAQTMAPKDNGTNFTPRRFRRILTTYPAGWSEKEVGLYRERCQEALDIFTETHMYRGVKGGARLELVPLAQSPDEAVAGQLPFIFSEVARYPGLIADDYFKIVGKQRDGHPTLRVMNIDIGGGTTDISIIEYRDRSSGGPVAYSDIATKLLFKDGQTLAGDDLLKDVIEHFVLGSLVGEPGVRKGGKGGIPEGAVRRIFTTPASKPSENSRRSRIVRTCLIPLGLHCMGVSGASEATFSSIDAGINQNNWSEFAEFLGTDGDAMPRDAKFFTFHSAVFNELVERRFASLFRNCQFYAAAYDADLIVFSGKTSELPHFRTMAERYLPLEASRIIFARAFKPGVWYPFTDAAGAIEDAKTVTTVGAGLYYALSGGYIRGWRISKDESAAYDRNEWGELLTMKTRRKVFLSTDENVTATAIPLQPNCSIGRRRTMRSMAEPVYRFIIPEGAEHRSYNVKFERTRRDEPDGLRIVSVDGTPIAQCPGFNLKLWPDDGGGAFWQDTGLFDLSDIDDKTAPAQTDKQNTEDDEEEW